MEQFEKDFGRWVLRYRWWIILFTLAIVVASASGGRLLRPSNDYHVFFSDDNPQLLAFETLEKTYSKNDNVLFVITPEQGDIFTTQTLSAITELTERAWKIPYATRVDSISNFQYTHAEQDDLIVEDLVVDSQQLSDQQIQQIRSIALAEPLLANRLVSANGRTTGINVTFHLPGIDPVEETPQVVAFSRELAAEFTKKYPHLNIRLVGMVMMNNAFTEAAMSDMKSLIPLSFGIMIIFLAMLLRGFTGSAVTLLVILFSIVSAMGIGGYLGFPITPPSMSAPIIILTIAIAASVHVLVTFMHERANGIEKQEAILESLRVNLQPVFLASITTALGFLSMNFSEVPPFQHLGNLVAIGVGFAFVFTVTFLPAMMSLLPTKAHHANLQNDPIMDRFAGFVINQRTTLLIGITLLVGLLISFIPKNELNDVFVHYFDKRIEFRRDADFTTENLTGLYLIEYSLKSGSPGGISEPTYLQQLAAFADWYRQQPEVLHINTITDVFKRLNRNMHGDEDAWYRLPQQRDLAAQYLLLYEMSLPYGLDLNNQIDIDKSSTRFIVTAKTISTNQLLALENRAQEWLIANAPAISGIEGSGATIMFSHIGKRNIKSMLLGTTLALIMISCILVIAFRSVKIGLISVVPNLLPAAMGFGIWGISVGEIGLALSIVTGMTLGIVVDDTVHYLSKYLRARREKGMSAPESVRYAFNTVGRALLITTVVLVAGFLVLTLSSFHLNSGMGMLTAIVLVCALVADFLLLPPLLMKLEEKKDAILVPSTTATDSVSS